MKEASITFNGCISKLNELLNNHYLSWIPINEIPVVLHDDFSRLNVGNTMAMIDGIECVPYEDFRKWYYKIKYEDGIDYQIKWESEA